MVGSLASSNVLGVLKLIPVASHKKSASTLAYIQDVTDKSCQLQGLESRYFAPDFVSADRHVHAKLLQLV